MSSADPSARAGSAALAAACSFRNLFAFLCQILLHFVLKGDQTCKDEEGTRSKDEDRKRLIGIRHNLESEDLSGADQLSDDTDRSQADRKSKSHANAVENGRKYGIL